MVAMSHLMVGGGSYSQFLTYRAENWRVTHIWGLVFKNIIFFSLITLIALITFITLITLLIKQPLKEVRNVSNRRYELILPINGHIYYLQIVNYS